VIKYARQWSASVLAGLPRTARRASRSRRRRRVQPPVGNADFGNQSAGLTGDRAGGFGIEPAQHVLVRAAPDRQMEHRGQKNRSCHESFTHRPATTGLGVVERAFDWPSCLTSVPD